MDAGAVLRSVTTCSSGGPAARLRAALAQLRLDELREARIGCRLEVLLVDPGELLGIELRRRARHVGEVEPLDELLAREDLLVAVRPAQAREVVEQRFGQVALVAVLR